MWFINRLIVTQSFACVALEFDAAVARRQLTEVMKLDCDFHEQVAAAAHNRMPAEILRVLPARLRHFWAISLADEQHLAEVQAEHTAIVDALERNHAEAAEAAVHEHVLSFQRALLQTR